MRAAVFLGERRVTLRDFPDPEPRSGEVVVAIKASGMCGSDLHYYRGPHNDTYASGSVIAGHEPAGIVHAVGPGVPDDAAAVGQRVMVHHYAGCGTCDACRSGWTQMCTTSPARVFGMNDHGAHAAFMRVPASTVVPLDPALSFAAGAAISCGTGTAWGALERLADVGGATLAVFGQGPVGLSATMLAAARGAQVIAVDPAPARRAQAERFGAVAAIDPTVGDAAEKVRELTGGSGVQLALETSAASTAADAALRSLAPWGRACFVGMGGEIRFTVPEFHRTQMTLLTSWSMSIVGQHQCAQFIARHQLPVDELFTHRWPLDDVADAYAEFDKQAGGKAVIEF